MDRTRTWENADDFDRIYISGEIEAERETENRKMGILYTQCEVEALHHLAEEAGSKVVLEPMRQGAHHIYNRIAYKSERSQCTLKTCIC